MGRNLCPCVVKGEPHNSFTSYAGRFIGIFLFLAALWVLRRTLSGLGFAEIRHALHSLPGDAMGKALLLTGINYLVLTCHDWLALKYIKRKVGYARISLAAFVSYAFSNGLGFSAITSSSVRFRFYSAWGLDGMEIAKVVSFCTVTMGLGLCATAGVSLLTQPRLIPTQAIASLLAVRLTGAFLLCLVAAYLLLCAFHRRSYSFRKWDFSLPSFPLSVSQLVVSFVDWAIAAGVLYVLIPSVPGLTYTRFLTVFLLAQTAGIVSQVPGGLGVLESVVAMLLAPAVPVESIIASFVVYRAIYYLLPFSVAAGLLGVRETFHSPGKGRKKVDTR